MRGAKRLLASCHRHREIDEDRSRQLFLEQVGRAPDLEALIEIMREGVVEPDLRDARKPGNRRSRKGEEQSAPAADDPPAEPRQRWLKWQAAIGDPGREAEKSAPAAA
jgi:hypothetical protein